MIVPMLPRLPFVVYPRLHIMAYPSVWFKIYLISMNPVPTALLLVLLCLQAALAEQCEASHFDFIGKYTLGQQDELNKTFTRIQEKIPALTNATFVVNETTTYTIFNAQPTFFYRDSKQRAQINGNDTVIITGGQLEADITFEWKRTSLVLNRTGSGAAFGLSNVITFVKRAVVIEEGSFFSFELADYEDVNWNSGDVFSLTRVDPATVTDEDKAALTRLLNNILGVKTIRNTLEEEIDKFYSFYLRASLHDEHMPVDNHFDYVWVPGPGKKNVTVPFSRRAVAVDLEEDGARLRFEVQVANSSDWKCGNRSVEGVLQLNPRVYGSTQQFVSYDFYENVIRYAISKNLLDSDLTRESWESRMFQFAAGDLYEVLAQVQNKFFAADPVTGNCRASFTGLKVWKSGFDTFNVSVHFDCELNIVRTKVLDFAVGLDAEVEALPQATTMDFKFRSHTEFVSFYPYAEYKILNEELGRAMIRHSLNRLYEGNLFGSGWPMSPPRDYPHMIAEDNFTVVYDSTHIDPHLVDL